MSPLDTHTPDEQHHVNALWYGDPGVGKTLLAGSAADYKPLSPVLFIDVEGGAAATLRGKKGLEIFPATAWSDLQEAYNVLRNEDHGFKTVVLDSATEIQQRLSMGNIMGEIDDEAAYLDLSIAVAPDRSDWHRTGIQMRKFIRAFRELARQKQIERRVHVIMTALEKFDEKRKLVMPELPGKLGSGAGAFFDIVGRLSVVRARDEDDRLLERRHLLVSTHQGKRGVTYLAKNRGGFLGTAIWEPKASSIFEAWMLGKPIGNERLVAVDDGDFEADEEEDMDED